jgi:hypothetical protein
MISKKILKKILLKFGISTYGTVKKKEILKIIDLLRPLNLGLDYIRLGGSSDGSYVVPKILDDIKFCFSAGYGGDCSFEKNLENLGIKSFLADYSFDAPTELRNFEYQKKFIKSYSSNNSINVNDWIEAGVPKDQKKMILQIDVEGSEYEIIHAITENNLEKFDIIVVEFHNLFLVNNQIFYKYFLECIQKLKKNFEIFYLQPNNCCGVSDFDTVIFPNVLEITFLNKSRIIKKDKFNFKNIEVKNLSTKKKIILPDYWY